MIAVLWAIVSFLIAITLLVAIHEYGHYIVARACNIKVQRFSIGFGRVIWRRIGPRSGTEFVISAIPIGGYVKMLDSREGPVPKGEEAIEFNGKPPWAKIAVVVAGPLFNILFAVLLYWLVFIVGIQTLVPVIGDVIPNSLAAQAGIEKGYEIVSINEKETSGWQQVSIRLLSHLGQKQPIRVGLRKANSSDTQEIRTHRLDVHKVYIDPHRPDILKSIGIEPYVPNPSYRVGKVLANSPAERAGMRTGDKVIAVNGHETADWKRFAKVVTAHIGKPLKTVVERDGRKMILTMTPVAARSSDGKLVGRIGIMTMPIKWPEHMIREVEYSPGMAFIEAWKRTLYVTGLTFKFLGKMITGDVPIQTLTGPIGIAKSAGITASIGWIYYLAFMALISISLGVINILPIPVLDGGHLVYHIIEWVRGKPISLRAQMLAFKVGILILIGLFMLTLVNDFIRLYS